MNIFDLLESPGMGRPRDTKGIQSAADQSAASVIGSGTTKHEDKKKPVTMMGKNVKEAVEEAVVKPDFKMPPESLQDKMYRQHQELRKKRGAPSPEEYKERIAQKQKEIDDLKEGILDRAAPKMPKPRNPANAVLGNKVNASGRHLDKKRRQELNPKHKHQDPLEEGWKDAVAGAALAGSIALGGVAHAGEPVVGMGQSQNMQMAVDMAKHNARVKYLKTIHGDNFQDKQMPEHRYGKLELKPNDKGGYIATVPLIVDAETQNESLRPGERHHFETDPVTGKRVYKGIRGDQYDAPQRAKDDPAARADQERKAHIAHDRGLTEQAVKITDYDTWSDKVKALGGEIHPQKDRNVLVAQSWDGEEIGKFHLGKNMGFINQSGELDETIRKMGSQYRLLSKKGKNLGTFDSKAGAEKHEREVQYFKHKNMEEDASAIKKKISKYEELALAANRAGDDAKCKMYQKKIQALKSQGVAEAEIPSIYSKQVPPDMEHRARYKCPNCGIANKVQDWAANDNECPTCLEPLPHGLSQMPLKYQGVAEGIGRGEYSRVLTALGLYYPRLSMEELNVPGFHKVIANKADVPVEYAAQVINDFVKANEPDDDDEQEEEYVSEARNGDTNFGSTVGHSSWVVYDGSKVKRFKSRDGAKAYAEKNGGKVASSEHYADKIQKQGVAEGWKGKLAGAALAGAAALGGGDVDAQNIDLPGPQAVMIAHIVADVNGREVNKTVNLGTQYDSKEQAEQDLEEYMQSKGITRYSIRVEQSYDQPGGYGQRRRTSGYATGGYSATGPISAPGLGDMIAGKVSREIRASIPDRGGYATGGTNQGQRPRDGSQWWRDQLPRIKEDVLEEDIESHLYLMSRAGYDIVQEEWSDKYKDSINCSNPKGFSQKAHCAGKKKNEEVSEEKVRLDPKCWSGKKIGNPKTKMKGGVRVNNCVPK